MVRNRSKSGKLANDCPDRIKKWVDKFDKLERKKVHLRSRLQLAEVSGKSVPFDDEETCNERIDKIKDVMKILKGEIRALEKDLGISRKDSDIFQGKGHRSKFEKLTGRKLENILD